MNGSQQLQIDISIQQVLIVQRKEQPLVQDSLLESLVNIVRAQLDASNLQCLQIMFADSPIGG